MQTQFAFLLGGRLDIYKILGEKKAKGIIERLRKDEVRLKKSLS